MRWNGGALRYAGQVLGIAYVWDVSFLGDAHRRETGATCKVTSAGARHERYVGNTLGGSFGSPCVGCETPLSAGKKAPSAIGGMRVVVFIVVRIYSSDKREAQLWLVPCAGEGCAQDWARARVSRISELFGVGICKASISPLTCLSPHYALAEVTRSP